MFLIGLEMRLAMTGAFFDGLNLPLRGARRDQVFIGLLAESNLRLLDAQWFSYILRVLAA